MIIRELLLIIAIWGLFIVEAQSQLKTARVGVLVPGSEASARVYLDGLRQGLREQGLILGESVSLEFRYANGRPERLRSLADELVISDVDLIFTGSDQAAWAVKRATDKIPIVAVTCDALASGLVTNLARPGGNMTGVTCINSDLDGKRVELIKESVRSLPRIAVILNPDDSRMAAEFRAAELAAKANS